MFRRFKVRKPEAKPCTNRAHVAWLNGEFKAIPLVRDVRSERAANIALKLSLNS